MPNDKEDFQIENYSLYIRYAYHLYEAGIHGKSFIYNKKLAQFSFKVGDLDLSERCYLRAIDDARKMNHIGDEVDCMRKLQEVYFAWNRNVEANQMNNKIPSVLNQTNIMRRINTNRIGALKETVFLNLNKVRYRWEDIGEGKIEIISTQIENPDFSIGLISDNLSMEIKQSAIKVLFFDLGNTLVHRPDGGEKFATFPQTDSILGNLRSKGIELAIISDGNRSQLETLLADPTLLEKFRLVVMSDDDEVGGIHKPKAKIFNTAIANMSRTLGFDLKPSETAFLTETVTHFKAYNFLYTMGLRHIIADDCREYIDH